MAKQRITKNKELVFVLPLIFAAGYLVLALAPTPFAGLFVGIAVVITALDVFALGIAMLIWLFFGKSDEPTPS